MTRERFFTEQKILYAFLGIYALLQVLLLLLGNSAYGFGGADNIGHYQISRYSFQYPQLFLDLWGKPVYTALSAPLAQLGYKAAKFFNLIVSVLTLLVSAQIARRLFPGSALFVALLIAFSPVYFLLSLSCLTEPLFAFVLVAAVSLFIRQRFMPAALVLSFLPLVRNEGIVVLPVFVLALALVKSYRALPLLLFGMLFYSLIGYVVFDDILWLIHKMPYSLGESLYGSGSLFHFAKHSHSVFGIPLLILIVAGLLIWTYTVLKNFSWKNRDLVFYILIVGSWVGYFAAHSYVWWKGTGGSLGLTRVLGGIIPLAAITGMKAFEQIKNKIKQKNVVLVVFSLFAAFQVVLFFTQHKLVPEADPTEQLMKKSATYIRSDHAGKKVFYFNPLLIHFLEMDPYDTRQCNWWVADKEQPSNTLEWGDLLVWDAHFGPNEGGVQLQNLINDPYLTKIKSFYPVEKVVVLGGYDYSIQIFEKTRTKKNNRPASAVIHRTLNFEGMQSSNLVETNSGLAWQMNHEQEFAPAIEVGAGELLQQETLDIAVSVEYSDLEKIGEDEVLLVLSIENEGEHLRYETCHLLSTGAKWGKGRINTRISANLPQTARISAYVWNKEGKKFLFRNLHLSIADH